VLYNGIDKYPDEKILKLSDAFSDPSELGLSKADFLSLELIVKVYNINKGHNDPIIRRCKTLEGYSTFIAKVREYEKKVKAREEAMKMAVSDCIKNNILKDFLEAHASEVVNMLYTEWNWDDALAVREEEGIEKGIEKGFEQAEKKNREKTLQMARKMKAAGIPPAQIQEFTGLSPEEIQQA
jgi:predicted transposase/invertase (TIGR01784 family)